MNQPKLLNVFAMSYCVRYMKVACWFTGGGGGGAISGGPKTRAQLCKNVVTFYKAAITGIELSNLRNQFYHKKLKYDAA